MNSDQFVARRGNDITLPLNIVTGRTLEPIPVFSSGKVSIDLAAPEIEYPKYRADDKWLTELAHSHSAAITVVRKWQARLTDVMFRAQLEDTPSERFRGLHDHTELLSVLCDSRLKIDPSVLWRVFDGALGFGAVHSSYWKDPERAKNYSAHVAKLEQVWDRISETLQESRRFTGRIAKLIELRSQTWSHEDPIVPPLTSPAGEPVPDKLRLFFSYSHKDEALRDQLETHIALLQRQGVIESWHDRRIDAGVDWRGKIDQELNRAHIILLLISADFVASDYCYDVEMASALERHRAGFARVVPIILRACEWSGAPFGELQALPRDAKPVKSWSDLDEAMTDVARGIKKVATELARANRRKPE